MVNITGTAFIENGSIVLVEISIDDQEWREITGSEEWYWAKFVTPDAASCGVFGGLSEFDGVSHWMPLPDPPTTTPKS